jgi:TPR repeat protein
MRRQLLWITLAITIMHSDLAGAQSLPSTSIPKSSHIDLKELVKRANEGSPVAQSQLGLAYQFGQGVDNDPYEAIRWYRMAANSGDPLAQNNLGYLYETGA